jgi:hypothetical protein
VGDTAARAVDRIARAMSNVGGNSIVDAGSARAVDPIGRRLFVSTCDGVETVAPVSRDRERLPGSTRGSLTVRSVAATGGRGASAPTVSVACAFALGASPSLGACD